MKIGIWIPSVRQLARPDVIRRSIIRAEQLGYDSIWTIDHVITPKADIAQFGLLYDPLIVMALAAGITERIEIGVSVLVLPYRHGVLTAKMVASLDDLSNGRIILGVGSGWNATESAILGLPFDERGAMTDEWIRVMKELWTNPEPNFSGKFTQFSAVEFGDAWHPINRTPDQLCEGWAEIEKLCQRFGREKPPAMAPRVDAHLVVDGMGAPAPAHRGHMVEGTPEAFVEIVEEQRELGAEHLILEFTARDADHYFAQVDAFAEKVRPRLGA